MSGFEQAIRGDLGYVIVAIVALFAIALLLERYLR